MAKAKELKIDNAEAVSRTVVYLYQSVFPDLSPDQVMEKLRSFGVHHHLMDVAWPSTSKLTDEGYGRALDEFEGELYRWFDEAVRPRKR